MRSTCSPRSLFLDASTPQLFMAERAATVGEQQGVHMAWEKYLASVVNVLGEHFDVNNPAEGHMLDAIETVLGTPRMKASSKVFQLNHLQWC